MVKNGARDFEGGNKINKKVKEYASELPQELRNIIEVLNNEYALAVFLYLFKYGGTKFPDIRSGLSIGYRGLWESLKKLQKCALVKEVLTSDGNGNCYTFYDVTNFGQKVIDNLMNIIKMGD